jgi:hypothetical protein
MDYPSNPAAFGEYFEQFTTSMWQDNVSLQVRGSDWGDTHHALFRVTAEVLSSGDFISALLPHLDAARDIVDTNIRPELTAVTFRQVKSLSLTGFLRRTGAAAYFFDRLQDSLGRLEIDDGSNLPTLRVLKPVDYTETEEDYDDVYDGEDQDDVYDGEDQDDSGATAVQTSPTLPSSGAEPQVVISTPPPRSVHYLDKVSPEQANTTPSSVQSSNHSPPRKRRKKGKSPLSEESHGQSDASSASSDMKRRTQHESTTDELSASFLRYLLNPADDEDPAEGDERYRVLAHKEYFKSKFGRIAWKAVNDGSIVRQRFVGGTWAIVGNGVITSMENKARYIVAIEPDEPPYRINPSLLGQQVSELLSLFFRRLVNMKVIDGGRVNMERLQSLSESERT